MALHTNCLEVVLVWLIRLYSKLVTWHNNFEIRWETNDMGYRLDCYLVTTIIVLLVYATIRGILEHFRKEVEGDGNKTS